MSGRVLITGGFGNLGSWIRDYFTQKDYITYTLSKRVPHQADNIIQADITDINSLRDKLKGIEFDYIIHTASYNEYFHKDYAKKALLVNALGTRNLVEVLQNRNIKKFIYISTVHIYGAENGVITEETLPNPKNDYASTHLFAEYYLKQFHAISNFPYIIFRLTNSYGSPKYMDSSKWYLVLNDLVKSAFIDKNITLKSNGEAKRDFIYMGDVCSVIEKSLYIKPNITLNLSSKETYTILELAKVVQLVYQNRYKKSIPIRVNRDDKRVYKSLIVDNSRLKELIDIEFSNRIEDEVETIFNLLESNNG